MEFHGMCLTPHEMLAGLCILTALWAATIIVLTVYSHAMTGYFKEKLR